MKKVKCAITGVEMDIENAYRAKFLRQQLFDLIKKEHPTVTINSFLDPQVVNDYRGKYLSNLISEENGDITSVENKVIQSIQNNEILSDDLKPGVEGELSYGQRLADKIAEFGGSWPFIIIFFSFIFIWMVVNIIFLANKAFDPYPFILLNLILSCIASIQAPIIMMSQNRQETKDRIYAQNDYMVNLKAELEIKLLHEKMDHLMVHQHMRLLEIQEIQTDYLKDILNHLKSNLENQSK